MRKWAVRVHRWTGLTLGLVLVVLGLSGSFNVFHREVDAWLNPAYWEAQARAKLRPSEALALAQARYPQMKAPLLGLPVDGGPYTLTFRDEALAADGRQFQLAIDPGTGEITGPRVHWGGLSFSKSQFVRTLYRLHYELLAPPWGHTLVGLSGLFLVGLIVLGVVLWWPRNGNWRKAFAFKRSAHIVRQMFDAHRLIGVVSALVLLFSGFSGSYIVFPDEFHAATALFGNAESLPRTVLSQTPGRGINMEKAIAIATAQFDDATPFNVSPPNGDYGTYRVRLRRTAEAHLLGRTFVWIEPATGNIVRIHDYTEQRGINRFYAWQFPLHNGTLFGMPGRIVVFIAGLAPLALLVSGLIVWRQKARARRIPIKQQVR